MPRGVVALALLPVVAALLAAIAGGLLRAGVPLGGGEVLGHAAAAHAALIVGAFFGTLIGVESAAALRHRLGWLGPLASAAAGPALLGGATMLAGVLLLAASLGLVGVGARRARRQPGVHTALRLAGAACWLIGNAGLLAGAGADAIAAWWFAFLLATIVGERFERARPARHDAPAQRLLWAILGALAAGAALGLAMPAPGGVLYGTALLALAAWLARHDIGRRALRAGNAQQRFIAACLLSADAWLGIGGVAWAANALGWPARDIALHALGLGFVVAMLMGHAPLILPVLTRIKVRYGGFFQAPLALLQLSLVLRFAGGAIEPRGLALGALLNAASLALFLLAMAGGAIAWRRREAPSLRP